jgi:Domain of unknown function (DUF4105)
VPALAVVYITVLTMSPGGDLFARFGHTAIRVEDDAGARVYNFGAFKGDDPLLVSQFLHNAIPYYLSVVDAGRFAGKYSNRTITGQELALDDAEARRFAARLDFIARPENRNYQYDWFRNNCTTRTRDVIDEALGGAWKSQLAGRPARWHHSIRALLRDALWSAPSLAHWMSIGLGRRVDERLDAWQELVMPFDLMQALREARRSDGRPLVAHEWGWEGPSPRPGSEPRWLQPLCEALLLYMVALGAFVRGRAARVAGGVGLALFGAFSVLVTVWLVFATLIPYPDSFLSENFVAYSPLAALLVPAGVCLARGRAPSRRARRAVEIIVALTLSELILHAVGVLRQAHFGFTLYALAALALSWLALRRAEAEGVLKARLS